MDSDYMEKLYKIYSWPDNPFTEEGRRRYESTLKTMEKIVKHKWFEEIISGRDKIGVIEYCGAYGIGGVALSRILKEKYNVEIEFTIIDLRRDALKGARRFVYEELGIEPKILVGDVTEKINFDKRHDIALLWGHSTPHFNPWSYVKLLSNIHNSLKEKSLYIYDESDRITTIFTKIGYKHVLSEITSENIVLTMHKTVDPLTGYIHRIAYDLTRNKHIEMKIYFWGLADTMAYTWIFFEDIDFIPLKTSYSGVVLARNPRKTISPDKYLELNPSILSNK